MLLVLMDWSWALVISDSVTLFKWPFRNQFHDFMSAIFSVSLMNWPWSLLSFQSCFLLFVVFFSYYWGLCNFLFHWWSPCYRDEPFLTILDIMVKPCYCILYTFPYADKSSVSFFPFDLQTLYINFGVMYLLHSL